VLRGLVFFWTEGQGLWCLKPLSILYQLYRGGERKMVFKDRRPLKRSSIHMEFAKTGQEKDDLLIQVTVK
jgi:hypothetical protein